MERLKICAYILINMLIYHSLKKQIDIVTVSYTHLDVYKRQEYTHQPEMEDNYSLKWDGEWQITFEVFRDLGIAFAVVILMIYILIVGWFQNFTVPIIMLAAIPLSLIGIILGHWMMHAYFTATSMIGFIALAGVMVRNSVLLLSLIHI